MKSLARMLRSQMTDAERLLWHHLRARRLGGFRFRRQMVIEPYIVDFACLDVKLVVEADGGQHEEQQDRDRERTAYLETLGYRVLRFWNHEILNGTQVVLERIHHELIVSPHPNPLPEGEGAEGDHAFCERAEQTHDQ
jgi:very-short-patch-repair endonuclease